MGVARGRCWAAGVVAGVLACVLAVAPSASAADVSVSSGAGVSSGGVVQAPSAGSPSGSPSAGSSKSWPAGVPDPSSWLRNVKVSDVGAHTANVSFDWDLSYLLNGKQSGSYKDQYNNTGKWSVDYEHGGTDYLGASVDPAKDVDGVCFTIGVGRATSITPAGDNDPAWIVYDSLACGDSDPTSPYTGVADDKLTASDYQRIYGTRTEKIYQGGKVTGQEFSRYYPVSLAEAGAKPGELKGHYDMALIGLDANTLYGNTKDTTYMDTFYGSVFWGTNPFWDAAGRASFDLYKKGVRTATKVDIRGLRLGVALHLKDSSKAVQQCKADKSTTNKSGCNIVFPSVGDAPDYSPVGYSGYVTAAVPDFRTGVEPAVASSVSKLPASARGRISVDASAVKQGSVARFYVDGLKKAARGKADASSLFWSAYIYSSPQRLSGPDGAPYVTVRKDPKGRYYFDAIVPAGLKAGPHTVSLVDGSGACQGWTPVTVAAGSGYARFRDVSSSTPHADDIGWLADAKVSEGWLEPDGSRTFRGMDSVKRQDMAAFLRREAKRLGVKDAASWKPSDADWKQFRDVSSSTPHAEDVLWLAHANVSTGWPEPDGSRTFRGMDPVRRQDMAAFLYRLAVKAGRGGGVRPGSFRDVSDATPHASEVRWLGGSGVSTGYADGTFRGMLPVYRQDMAAFLHRFDGLK
ncbi:S-layer homology domain-containing protein [Bifidobacterium boum]|uniref:S-layer homology domain-containing protein n=1 Tax=Bifidobacterium boum TaxID=78343 RepID=UPI001F4863D3|nr:S-layer homology domain-containing protein [Bifidobacterium boum]